MGSHRTRARRVFAAALGFLFACRAIGAPNPSYPEVFAAKYAAIRNDLISNDFGVPIFVESVEREDYLCGDVFGVMDCRFEYVKDVLRSPVDWCDFACLHMNVKAAVYSGSGTNACVLLYIAGKRYKSPERSEPIGYDFEVEQAGSNYVRVAMTSEDGPHGTREHRLYCEAMPVGNDKCLVHMSYACHYGLLGKTLMTAYLQTGGRKRVGFSVSSTVANGERFHIKGVRGIVERNAMRYYIAVNAHLSALGLPADEAFEQRINRWYDDTMRHPKQLDDLKKDQYLDYKRKERKQRQRLQQELAEQ